MLGLLLGSFCNSHSINLVNSGDVDCGDGGTTGACRIFIINAY